MGRNYAIKIPFLTENFKHRFDFGG
jgi:hypothetical protein